MNCRAVIFFLVTLGLQSNAWSSDFKDAYSISDSIVLLTFDDGWVDFAPETTFIFLRASRFHPEYI